MSSHCHWNINSVRLRIGNVERFLKLRKPDVLCLQETKTPDEFFPHAAFEKLGYTHRLIHGMKGYNGVASSRRSVCRTTSTTLRQGGLPAYRGGAHTARSHPPGQSLHPAGGDIPDPR